MFSFLRFRTLLSLIERNHSAALAKLNEMQERLEEAFKTYENVENGRATKEEIGNAKKACLTCKEGITKVSETIVQTTPTAKSPINPTPSGTDPEFETVTTPESPEKLTSKNTVDVGLPGTVSIDVVENMSSEVTPVS